MEVPTQPTITPPMKAGLPRNRLKAMMARRPRTRDRQKDEGGEQMDFKKVSFGLGVFSIALGAAELMASRRITRSLEAEGHEGIVKAFGVREIVAGVGLLQSPAHSARVWNRVAGDGMDLGALALAARSAPRSKAVWGAIAFVVGAAVLDTVVALGLDRTTGKTTPARAGASDSGLASVAA
jgi:hypothetical protein